MSKSIQSLTVGADPEVFLYKDGWPYPVVGLLGGTKENPLPVSCGAVQEDNVLAEFNILPSYSEEDFVSNITTVMSKLHELLRDYELKVVPSADFRFRDLMEAGDKAMEFGCDPDYNAWTGKVNPSPSPGTTLRTAGGHIHLGHPSLDPSAPPEIIYDQIKMMDIYLGVPSVIMDSDKERRKMYGKAGAFRRKEYGVEYRTLSNFWIKDEEHMRWAYSNTTLAFDMASELPGYLEEISSEVIQSTINNSDVAAAEMIVSTLNIPTV